VILKQVKGLIVDRAKSLGLVYAGTPAKGQFEEAPHASA